jgi:hypothetical protein
VNLLKTYDFKLIEGINGMRDPCINVSIQEILKILEKELGKEFIVTAGSDDHTFYQGTTWTALEHSDTKEDFLENLRKGNGIMIGGEQGTPAKTMGMVWDYLYSRMNPEFQDYLNDLMVRIVGSLDKMQAGTYPLLSGRILKEWNAMYEQSNKIRADFDLKSLSEAYADFDKGSSVRERKIRVREEPEVLGLARVESWDKDTIIFFTDVPLGHHSGVGMWLDEMVKYAGKNGPDLVILQPATEHVPFGYSIEQVNDRVRAISFRQSVKLYPSQEVTKDFPIDPTLYLAITMSKQEHGKRSLSKMMTSRGHRLVKPYSWQHSMIRALIDKGALGRPQVGVFIQDGPYSKLGYAECKGYLDIPKVEVFVTIIAGFVTERLRKLIKGQFKLPDEVLDYEPVDSFLTEVLDPFKDMMWESTIGFLNKCEMVLAPPAMVEILKEKGLSTKLDVFSRGVDTTKFKPGKKENEKLRIFYAGRLTDPDHKVSTWRSS